MDMLDIDYRALSGGRCPCRECVLRRGHSISVTELIQAVWKNYSDAAIWLILADKVAEEGDLVWAERLREHVRTRLTSTK